jgi:hypothetical protein
MADDLDAELIGELRRRTGIVNLKGLVTWSQQHLLESLNDPLCQEVVEILRSIDVSKRDWKKVLKMLSEKRHGVTSPSSPGEE